MTSMPSRQGTKIPRERPGFWRRWCCFFKPPIMTTHSIIVLPDESGTLVRYRLSSKETPKMSGGEKTVKFIQRIDGTGNPFGKIGLLFRFDKTVVVQADVQIEAWCLKVLGRDAVAYSRTKQDGTVVYYVKTDDLYDGIDALDWCE